jgi:hypothetical protein
MDFFRTPTIHKLVILTKEVSPQVTRQSKLKSNLLQDIVLFNLARHVCSKTILRHSLRRLRANSIKSIFVFISHESHYSRF